MVRQEEHSDLWKLPCQISDTACGEAKPSSSSASVPSVCESGSTLAIRDGQVNSICQLAQAACRWLLSSFEANRKWNSGCPENTFHSKLARHPHSVGNEIVKPGVSLTSPNGWRTILGSPTVTYFGEVSVDTAFSPKQSAMKGLVEREVACYWSRHTMHRPYTNFLCNDDVLVSYEQICSTIVTHGDATYSTGRSYEQGWQQATETSRSASGEEQRDTLYRFCRVMEGTFVGNCTIDTSGF